MNATLFNLSSSGVKIWYHAESKLYLGADFITLDDLCRLNSNVVYQNYILVKAPNSLAQSTEKLIEFRFLKNRRGDGFTDTEFWSDFKEEFPSAQYDRYPITKDSIIHDGLLALVPNTAYDYRVTISEPSEMVTFKLKYM